MDKKIAKVDMLNSIIYLLCVAPLGQVAKYIKEETIKFRDEEHTAVEKFEYLVKISQKPMIKITDKLCVGDISSFVKAMCELELFYLKPE